jgi:hypothetical protein
VIVESKIVIVAKAKVKMAAVDYGLGLHALLCPLRGVNGTWNQWEWTPRGTTQLTCPRVSALERANMVALEPPFLSLSLSPPRELARC